MKSIRTQFVSLTVVVLCIVLVVSLLPENLPSETNRVQSDQDVTTTVYAGIEHPLRVNP